MVSPAATTKEPVDPDKQQQLLHWLPVPSCSLGDRGRYPTYRPARRYITIVPRYATLLSTRTYILHVASSVLTT